MQFFKSQNENPQISILVEKMVKELGEIPTTIIPLEQFSKEELDSYDIDVFIDDLCEFLTQYNKETDVFKSFTFLPEHAYSIPTDDEGNSVRFSLHERTNATSEQSGHNPHGGRKNYKWRLHGTFDDHRNPGYKALLYVRPMDNTIDITSWSKNGRDASKAALILEKLLDTYQILFKKKGLIELRYEKRLEDVARERNNFVLYGCPLRFYIKTIQTNIVYEKTLEEIAIQTTVN
jgi:hypothetical protein